LLEGNELRDCFNGENGKRFAMTAPQTGDLMNRQKLIFGSVVYPTEFSERSAVLLAESIRSLAGSLSKAPVWYFLPDYGKKLSSPVHKKLEELNIEIIPFKVVSDVPKFPFSFDIIAAEKAESKANGRAGILAWLGSNTIVFKEPADFVLAPEIMLGYRPVHHTLVGSRYDKAINLFWRLVYEYCNVPEDRIFPMIAHIDGVRIRPYFNAGFLIIRPERKLLGAWRKTFVDTYKKSDFQDFYRKDEKYAIFMHQAILSGVILSHLAFDELIELPHTYNYPLHLYDEDVTQNRPKSIDVLITARHEGLGDPEWMRTMAMESGLREWLAGRTGSH
jgi:hypothetical protein